MLTSELNMAQMVQDTDSALSAGLWIWH